MPGIISRHHQLGLERLDRLDTCSGSPASTVILPMRSSDMRTIFWMSSSSST
jgi:hypothetical protein